MDNNKVYIVEANNSIKAFTDINEAKAYYEQNKAHKEVKFFPANIDTTKYANDNTYSFVYKITVSLNDESIKNRIGFEVNLSSVKNSVTIKAYKSIISLHHDDISLIDIINDECKNDYIKALNYITVFPYTKHTERSNGIYKLSRNYNFTILIIENDYDLDHVLYEAAFRLKLFIDGIIDKNIDINDHVSFASYRTEFTNDILNTELTNNILNSDNNSSDVSIEKVDEECIKKILDKAKNTPTYKYLSFNAYQNDIVNINSICSNSKLTKDIIINTYLCRAITNEVEKAIYDNKPIDEDYEDYICGKVVTDLVGEVYNVK